MEKTQVHFTWKVSDRECCLVASWASFSLGRLKKKLRRGLCPDARDVNETLGGSVIFQSTECRTWVISHTK